MGSSSVCVSLYALGRSNQLAIVESSTSEWLEIRDPVCISFATLYLYWILTHHLCAQSTQTLLTKVPETTAEEFNLAAYAASEAFKSWRKTSILTRQKFLLELVHSLHRDTRLDAFDSFQTEIRKNAESITESMTLEQGKTITDAHGDLHRGLQAVQAAASVTTGLMGEKLEGRC